MPKASASRKLETADDLIAYLERKIMRGNPAGVIRNQLFEKGFEPEVIERLMRAALKRVQKRAIQDISMELAMPTQSSIIGPPPPPLLHKVTAETRLRKRKKRLAPVHLLVDSVELQPFPPKRPSIRVEPERLHMGAFVTAEEKQKARRARRTKRKFILGALVALMILNPISIAGWLFQQGGRMIASRQTSLQSPASAPLVVPPAIPEKDPALEMRPSTASAPLPVFKPASRAQIYRAPKRRAH